MKKNKSSKSIISKELIKYPKMHKIFTIFGTFDNN